MSEISLINYQELLNKLASSSSNHLLLGNGFNNSLGIETNYSEIFSRMRKEYSGYQHVERYLSNESFDIEKLIDHLKNQVQSNGKDFLESYIERKVKLDFMKAANEIVQENIKNVYQEHNQGIYLLFKNFTNYFTLNYDPLLYLLLLKFKKEDSSQVSSSVAMAFQNTSLFIEKDLDIQHNHIYKKIKQAKDNGKIRITVNDNHKTVPLSKIKKMDFISTVKNYFQDEGWKNKDIEKTCNQIWKEEQNIPKLSIQDGCQGIGQGKFFKEENLQNLYFLHGAFQLVKKGNAVEKITAKQNKAFVQILEEAIDSKDKDIICVLTNQSEEKKMQINDNVYLKKCFNALSKIDGSLVILGSSLADNDQHIFDQINKSDITQIYISSREQSKERNFQRASNLFTEKRITLFDYTTISYKGESN